MKHTKENFDYCLTAMLERASYYGLRALIVLYMISKTIKMDRTEALEIYGWFTVAILFSRVLGALVGDLLIGNRKSIFIGGIIQALGAFTICYPSIYGLYIGLFLVILGNGLFSLNVTSNFGKMYLGKIKLLDAGFTIFHLAINLGTFLGIFLLGYVGEKFGFHWGFFLSGLLILISLIPILKTAEKELPEYKKDANKNSTLIVIVTFIIVAFFWAIYEIVNIRVFEIKLQLSEFSTSEISIHIWESMNAYFTLPIGIVAVITWTCFYNSQYFKLLMGFVFGGVAYGIILLIPEILSTDHTIYLLISLVFLTISEIHISPILNAVLTKYSNPKYLTILISLSFIPSKIIAVILGLFDEAFFNNPILGVQIGITATAIISIGIMLYLVFNKATQKIIV